MPTSCVTAWKPSGLPVIWYSHTHLVYFLCLRITVLCCLMSSILRIICLINILPSFCYFWWEGHLGLCYSVMSCTWFYKSNSFASVFFEATPKKHFPAQLFFVLWLLYRGQFISNLRAVSLLCVHIFVH